MPETINPYPQLEALCLPFIESYHNDLLEIDRTLIEQNPGKPFIHYTRKWGTYLIGLPDADHPYWPAEDVKIPYIFSEADRLHILRETAGIPAWMEQHYPTSLVHWFNGQQLVAIDHAKAKELVLAWRTHVQETWWKTSRLNPDRQLLAIAA